MSIGIDKLAHMNTPALSDILLAHSAAEGTGVVAIGDLPKLLNAGNLKMPDSEETIAEHYRQFCNRNLLINWYFLRPVNQQGLTAYQVRGYTIDMWRTWTAASRVSLSENGVLVDRTNADADGIYQYFEDGESLLVGKIVTISVLTKEYGLINKSGILTSGSSSIIQTTEFGDIALFHSLTKTPPFFFRISVNAGKAVTVIAAKLEFGSSQTLAHKEGSKWVLNEIPDYTAELEKCQRYFWRYKFIGEWSKTAFIQAFTATRLEGQFIAPVQMRTLPTIKTNIGDDELIATKNANVDIPVKYKGVIACGDTYRNLWLTFEPLDSSKVVLGDTYFLRNQNNKNIYLDFDANL